MLWNRSFPSKHLHTCLSPTSIWTSTSCVIFFAHFQLRYGSSNIIQYHPIDHQLQIQIGHPTPSNHPKTTKIHIDKYYIYYILYIYILWYILYYRYVHHPTTKHQPFDTLGGQALPTTREGHGFLRQLLFGQGPKGCCGAGESGGGNKKPDLEETIGWYYIYYIGIYWIYDDTWILKWSVNDGRLCNPSGCFGMDIKNDWNQQWRAQKLWWPLL